MSRGTLLSTVASLVISAAIIGTIVAQSVSSSAPSFSDALRGDHADITTALVGAVTQDDGVLPDEATVLDDQLPGVANLDPELFRALRKAARDAADEGITLYVNSGWRSAEYQNLLLRQAVAEYGSEGEADRWVASADTSAHVSGTAVDIGHVDATSWLSEHGASYGLCQTYDNEPWHYELRPEATTAGCPPLAAHRGFS